MDKSRLPGAVRITPWAGVSVEAENQDIAQFQCRRDTRKYPEILLLIIEDF